MNDSWDPEVTGADPRGQQIESFLIRLGSTARPRARHLAVALLLSLLFPALLALKPDLILNYTLQDAFIPIDAAWRALQGQWPHTDFYSPLGLVYFAQHGAAAWLWGLNSQVVSRAGFIALPFVLIPALFFASQRLSAFSTILLMLVLTIMLTSPAPLDGPERYMAYLANYNALGGALCAVLTLWALGLSNRRRPALEFIGAVVAGVLLLLLLFLKITFFALATVIVLTGCVVTRRKWRMAIVAAVVVGLGAAALELVHPGLLAAYVMDLRRARAANTTLFRIYHVWKAIHMNLLPVLLILGLSAVWAWVAPQMRWAAIAFVGVSIACVLVATQNFDGFSAPLIVLIMILCDRLQAGAAAASSFPPRPQLATAFPAAFRAPSPRGVALWWDQDRTYSATSLTPAMALGDAQVVMVPKVWYSYYDVTDLLAAAQDTLDAGFTPYQSHYWTAWVQHGVEAR